MARVKWILPLALLIGCSERGQTPPPWGVPITGGTMMVTRDGSHAVIADPDRDRIVSVDLITRTVVAEIALTPGDEPGRVIEDGAGRIHVALRRGGSLVTLASANATAITERRWACGEPRGLAYQASTDAVHVACAGGELVTFAAAGGDAVRSLRIERDLRDIVVRGEELVVTRFRTAELLTIDAQGVVLAREKPPIVQRFGGFGGPQPDGSGAGDAGAPSESGGLVNAVAAIAWRTIALPDGRIVMTHQRQVQDTLDAEQEGGYGSDCGGGPVETALTVVAPGQLPFPVQSLARGALPVDIATTPSGDRIAVVVAGRKTVQVMDTGFALGSPDRGECPPPDPMEPPDDDDDDDKDDDTDEGVGAPTSAAFRPNGELIVFYPEKPAIEIRAPAGAPSLFVRLPGHRGADAGRAVFHAQTQIGVSCASCHPEGREDGLVWDFAEFGKRRTQSLAGHILERAPYHWSGDMASLPVLMDDVFAVRMAGGQLTSAQKSALGPWLDRIPAPPAIATADVAAVDRGRDIFESADAGCVACHNGDLYSNNKLVNVGTGGLFKVPSLLGVGARAPYMHDGCAQTLMDRFTVCGNSAAHGQTSHLAPAELGDLVTYLESL